MTSAITIQCPLCNDAVDKLVYRYHLDSEREVIDRIKVSNPGWTKNDGACSRCIDYYHTEIVLQQRILPDIGPYFPIRSADDFIILPTGLRLDANPRYTGKGITICFIDSGFFLHPDLTEHYNRVKKVLDITDETRGPDYFRQARDESWHGTMTSVVCAGDGYQSGGLYKGIASNAELVLLKVQDDEGRITAANITKALQWISGNHKEYDIRIVNISLGSDESISFHESMIDQLAEQLTEKGITVVAAAGNDENGTIKPPANSPNVITVGGLDDINSLLPAQNGLYHSSYGKTIDGFMKPELIAPAIWVAAPILPGTKEKKEAETLYGLLDSDDKKIVEKLPQVISGTKLNIDSGNSNNPVFIKQSIRQRIQEAKFISPSYLHADGTSFAAPVTSAVIAQMLEADSSLTPAMIRAALFSTSKRIETVNAERQGFGVIRPRHALLKVLKRDRMKVPVQSPFINLQQNTIGFYVQNQCASQVSLSGSFNHWAQDTLLLEPSTDGLWKIEIPLLPAGRYLYKFLVDEKMWLEDISNPYREPDGFNGFNSILIVNENVE